MVFSDLKRLIRGLIPKANEVSNELLELAINETVRDINSRLFLLKENSKFDVAADQFLYDLSDSDETVSRFLKIDTGLWWNAGTAASTNWKRLYPRTLKYLDKNFPQWRDANSSNPLYYVKDGKYLTIYPTPDTDLTEGFWLYFIENTRTMTLKDHYPFGFTSEIPEYSILTDVIAKGAEAFILPIVNEKIEGAKSFQEYLMLIEMKRRILAESPDINSEARFKIKRIC